MDIQWRYPTANNTKKEHLHVPPGLMDPNTGLWDEQLMPEVFWEDVQHILARVRGHSGLAF